MCAATLQRPAPILPQEHEARAERARALMTEKGLDALFVCSEPNFRYLTGFHSQIWVGTTRPRYFVLPRVGPPIAIVPTSHADAVRAGAWFQDIRTWQAPAPEDDGISLLVDALRAACGRFGAIGAELGPESRLGMPAADFLRVIESLGPVDVRDAVPILIRLRMTKSASEIERIAMICRIASDAFDALPASLISGDSERDVARKLQAGLIARGAEKTPYVVVESGPGGYEQVMMGPRDRRLRMGDVLFIDNGSTVDGYFCDFDRNFAIGSPHDAVRGAYALVHEATEAGIGAARPGARCADVWQAMAAIIERAGAAPTYVGRMGHGLGLSITEPPSIHPKDESVLNPGMVLTIEPSLTYPAGGSARKIMLHEEDIVVTEDGAAVLTRRAPPEIPVLDRDWPS